MSRSPTAKANPFDRGPRTELAGNLGEQAYQQIRTEILVYRSMILLNQIIEVLATPHQKLIEISSYPE
jgi:hypothetical protein